MNSTKTAFYVTGGTLPSGAPSYVERKADLDLLEGLRNGEFCYVLTSRQMGKSSLMVRTAAKLRAEGAVVAVLDLTGLGYNLSIDQWYHGLLLRICRQVGIEDAAESFWGDNDLNSPMQKWVEALHRLLACLDQKRLIIFIDEIDVVRSLPFSTDEFFAAIRSLHNQRTEEPALSRLTFCLLGVASPSDLIGDSNLTPFNIGRRVQIDDFSPDEAQVLAAGLGVDELVQEAILKRVLRWTNGHPYLTQRLCHTIVKDSNYPSPEDVDRLCGHIFLETGSVDKDDNLAFVRDRLLRGHEDRVQLLSVLLHIIRGRTVVFDAASTIHAAIRLSGVVKVDSGALRIRNSIYAHVFDQTWVQSNMPKAELRRQKQAFRRGLVAAAFATFLLLHVPQCIFSNSPKMFGENAYYLYSALLWLGIICLAIPLDMGGARVGLWIAAATVLAAPMVDPIITYGKLALRWFKPFPGWLMGRQLMLDTVYDAIPIAVVTVLLVLLMGTGVPRKVRWRVYPYVGAIIGLTLQVIGVLFYFGDSLPHTMGFMHAEDSILPTSLFASCGGVILSLGCRRSDNLSISRVGAALLAICAIAVFRQGYLWEVLGYSALVPLLFIFVRRGG